MADQLTGGLRPDHPPVHGLPIADYAFLSDCHGGALVSRAGSVDWLCFPRFDAPATFGRLLDPDAGHWSISPTADCTVERSYRDRSLVLETRFETRTGSAVLVDGLLFGRHERGHDIGDASPHVLARILQNVEGTIEFDITFAARPEYGLVRPRLRAVDGGLDVTGGADALTLWGPAPTSLDLGTAHWTLTLTDGNTLEFALQHRSRTATGKDRIRPRTIRRWLDDTTRAWQSWSDQHQTYDGPYRDAVHHSGRVLRALSYQPTGAIVAAPTTSLPEAVGGPRNWDYRYGWIGDACLTMNALWIAACPDEAGRFVRWIVDSAGSPDHERNLQIMYGIGGEHDLSERTLAHLSGWRASRPVRVGNGAWDQDQLDVYGEFLDAVHRYRDHLDDADDNTREFVVRMVDTAARRWREPDHGIWETRADPTHHLHSKLMCWVALDRGIDLATQLDAVAKVPEWMRIRNEIRDVILRDGWDAETGSFTASFGDPSADAATLMIAMFGFLPATDAKVQATIAYVQEELAAPRGLLYRYRAPDGLEGDENPFVLCSYWLVECLANAGRTDEARQRFEAITGHANDVGLLSEEIDAATGALLGNFPQAFSHVGLINAAWAIDQAERAAIGLRGRSDRPTRF